MPNKSYKTEVTEKEYCLTAVIISMTLDESSVTHGKRDLKNVTTALECFGYNQWESVTILWETIEKVGDEGVAPRS